MKHTLPKYKRFEIRGTIQDTRLIASGCKGPIWKIAEWIVKRYHSPLATYSYCAIDGVGYISVFDFKVINSGYFEVYSVKDKGPRKLYKIIITAGDIFSHQEKEDDFEYCL